MKTVKIEYFRNPGVTWLQIIYLQAFHCVVNVPYVSLFLLYVSFYYWFDYVSYFYCFSLFFIF